MTDFREKVLPGNAVWEQILSRDLVTEADIRAALYPGTEDRKRLVQLLLARPREGTPAEKAVQVIQQYFPQARIFADQREVVVLQDLEEQVFGKNLPEALEADLAGQELLLCAGNGFSHLDQLRSVYLMTDQMMRLVRKLRMEGEYLFYLEDYQNMMILDNSVKEFMRQNGTENIIYLTHPAVARLRKYDEEHGTELRQVLYHYLRYDGSIQKTAAAMYMHRNTIQNKLKKINELAPVDLHDGLLCERLLLSCQLLEYQEKILGK